MKLVVTTFLFMCSKIVYAQGTKASLNWKVQQHVQMNNTPQPTLITNVNLQLPKEKQVNEINVRQLQLLFTAFEHDEEILPIEIKEDALCSLSCCLKTNTSVQTIKMALTDTDFFIATVRQYKLSLLIKL